jgi:site-specific recombinase XerD
MVKAQTMKNTAENGMALDRVLSEFIDSRKRGTGTARKACRPRTLNTYVCDLTYFFDYMKKLRRSYWNEITRTDVTAFVDWMAQKSGWSKTSQGIRLRSLRALFKWIDDDEDCQEMGMHGFRKYIGKIERSAHRKLLFGPIEIKQFLSCFNLKTRSGLRNFTIVILFCDTGIRSGELRHLRLDTHVHLDRNMLTVPEEGKTGVRVVFIQDTTVAVLKRWIKVREKFCKVPYLFCDNKGSHQLGEMLLPQAFRAARLRSGIKGITPHMLRHHFTTAWLRRGGSVAQLMEMTGHKSTETLQYYITLTGDQSVREEQRRVNPLEGLIPNNRTGKARTMIG